MVTSLFLVQAIMSLAIFIFKARKKTLSAQQKAAILRQPCFGGKTWISMLIKPPPERPRSMPMLSV
jgi:hypothetical protein